MTEPTSQQRQEAETLAARLRWCTLHDGTFWTEEAVDLILRYGAQCAREAQQVAFETAARIVEDAKFSHGDERSYASLPSQHAEWLAQAIRQAAE